ncbi:MAG: isopeptide-forming domain-containing fimbrial protein [Minicystis sp.]
MARRISNGLNPADNFFNSSRSYLGQPVSGTYDVPKLSGQASSMAGYDLDTADVTSLLSPGDTSCVVGADSTKDIFFLGGFITSVASLAPDFHGMTKDVVDLNGGAILPGDTLEYTITAVNSGNDAADNAVITDVLENGLTVLPGSIEIVEGGAIGIKTNAAGDDEGDYDAASRTITWRVGSGADASAGGTVGVGEAVKVRFRATVAVQSGVIANQAILQASGDSGAPDKTWVSDGDPQTIGDQPTTVVVDECSSDAQCSGTKPHCNLTTHTCEGCNGDGDCPDPTKPACQPNGACGQCSVSNATLCKGDSPVCDTMSGTCVLCTLGPNGNADECQTDPDGPLCVSGKGGTVHCGCVMDTDCGDATSGKVCDTVPSVCIDGCRGMGGNGCPSGQTCTSTDTTIGTCMPDGTGGDGGGPIAGDEGRCGCEVPGGSQREGGMAALAAMLGLAAMVRRRRR